MTWLTPSPTSQQYDDRGLPATRFSLQHCEEGATLVGTTKFRASQLLFGAHEQQEALEVKVRGDNLFRGLQASYGPRFIEQEETVKAVFAFWYDEVSGKESSAR